MRDQISDNYTQRAVCLAIPAVPWGERQQDQYKQILEEFQMSYVDGASCYQPIILTEGTIGTVW